MNDKNRLQIIDQIWDLAIEIWSKSTDLTSEEETLLIDLQKQISLIQKHFKDRD